MDINSLGMSQTIQAFDPSRMFCGFQSGETPFNGGIEDSGLNISTTGKMMTLISGMSAEDKAEMQAFHQEMRNAIESGTFDAAEMAEKAPESLKAFAEKNGLDLEEMLTKMAKGGPPPGGPPPELYNSEGIGIPAFDQEHTMNLISQLFTNEDSADESLTYLTAT